MDEMETIREFEVIREYAKRHKRMCHAYPECKGCPLDGRGRCDVTPGFTEEMYKTVMNWEPPKPSVDWSRVKVDTKILVWDSDENDKRRRYFARYENGKVYTWIGGATSWTAEIAGARDTTVGWDHAELAEEVERG